MLWAHQVGVGASIKAGERPGVEPAGKALDLVTRRDGDLDAARAWAAARTFGSVSSGACAPTVRAILPGSKSSLAVGNRPSAAIEGHWSP
jgi:hypothetical protein